MGKTLSNISKFNQLNAYVSTEDPDQLMKQAEQSDINISKG